MGPQPSLPPKTSMASSSPGKAEKLPTVGLARLLRGKSGNRSRVRSTLSHSSPLFSSGSRSHQRAAVSLNTGDGGEPSSPKVTCIGQVRMQKKSKSAPITSDLKGNRPVLDKKRTGERETRCCFIKETLFRRSSAAAVCRSIWRWSKTLRFEGSAWYRRENERINPAEPQLLPLSDLDERGIGIFFNKMEQEDGDEAECDESEIRVFVPPKNALVLMRCRSAPHNRPSAPATRLFPISALGDGEGRGKGEDEAGEETEINRSGSSNGGEEEDEDTRCPSSRPLFLKRCKSEPATKAARLAAPEAQNGGHEFRRTAEASQV